MSDELRDALHDAAADPPPTRDWRDLTRAGIAARRRRRLAAASTSGAAAVVLAAAVVVAVTSPSGRDELDSAGPAPLATATATPAVEPTPTAAPTPGPTVTPRPSEEATSSPRPAAEPTAPAAPAPTRDPRCAGDFQGDCPDGEPGWSGGFSGCHVATADDVPAAARPELFEGVTATWSVPTRVRGGQVVTGSLVLSNARADRVHLTVPTEPGWEGPLLGPRGGAVRSGDVLAMQQVVLEPGGSWSTELGLRATTCGDTSEDPEPPLPAGDYAAGRTVSFQDARTEPASSASPGASPASPGAPVPARGTFAVRLGVTVT